MKSLHENCTKNLFFYLFPYYVIYNCKIEEFGIIFARDIFILDNV